jgi:hypothetical protein
MPAPIINCEFPSSFSESVPSINIVAIPGTRIKEKGRNLINTSRFIC